MIAQDQVNKWVNEELVKRYKAGKKVTLGTSHTDEHSKNKGEEIEN